MLSTNESPVKSGMRIHILGASGSGTSTLGQALATRLGYTFFDTDTFYWVPTNPPFRKARDSEQRRQLLGPKLEATPSWVLSGSLCGWGDPFIVLFDVVVFLSLTQQLRMERLKERERHRYGAQRLAEGGDQHQHYLDFMSWAEKYDTAGPEIRSRRRHEEWLSHLPAHCRVMKLSSTQSVEHLTNDVVTACSRAVRPDRGHV